MKHKLKVSYAAFAILFSFAATAFRIYTVLNHTDAYGVYEYASVVGKILDISVFTVTVVLAIIPFVFRKQFDCKLPENLTQASAFASSQLAFVFITVSFLLLLDMASLKSFPGTQTIMMLTGIAGGVGILMTVFIPKRYNNIKAALSFAPIIWSLSCLIEVYFDMKILINSPNRAYMQTSLLALLLFFLAMSRRMLKLKNTSFHFAASAVATVLTPVCAIPNLVCSDILKQGSSDKPESYIIILSVFIFASVELLQSALHSKEKDD